MRSLTLVVVILMVVGTAWKTTRADPAATQPAIAGNGGVRDSLIAVLPLSVLGDTGHDWVGQAVQQTLVTEIRGGRGTLSLASASTGTGLGALVDAARARALGTSVHADFVVFGSVQFVPDQMRIIGQVVSVQTGRTIGKLSIDGSLRQLFTMEDELAGQATRLIAAGTGAPAVHSATTQPSEISRPTIQYNGPLTIRQSTYFDGDLSYVLAKPVRFQAEIDRYNYQQGSLIGAYGYGFEFGNCGFPIGGFGGFNSVPVTPISGW